MINDRSLIKNYYLIDYTIFTEPFIFTDFFFLKKKVSSNDFSIYSNFKTYIYSLEDENFSFETAFLTNNLFIENNFWNQKIILTDFLYLKTSSFISFFVNNNIDVPVCFSKSKSLSFRAFELPFLKLFNLLMRKGKRDKIIRIFFNKLINRNNTWNYYFKFQFNDTNIKNKNFFVESFYFSNILKNIKKENISFYEKHFLNFIYLFLFLERKNSYNFALSSINLRYKKSEIKTSFFFKNLFLKLFSEINPIFSYFIYSVDKNVRKYSRGKSGKYSFVWKFIAPYKRLFLSMRLFAKELKFRNEKKFVNRFLNSISILETDFKNSFVWQCKKFSHNYVFKNFRKTLMSSLKTISKK